MAIRKMTMLQWQKATAAALGKPSWGNLNGDSPGGVASQLGISRQAVHKAVHRGDLDAVLITGMAGQLKMFMIPQDSVEAFKAKRDQKRTG